MELPQLHRMLNWWWVGQYPLLLCRETIEWHEAPRAHRWRIMSAGWSTETKTWLAKTGLVNQRFETRRDALEATAVALEMPGAPSPQDRPICRAIGDGRYQLAGEFVAERDDRDRGWFVRKGDKTSAHAQTLWQAAGIAYNRHQREAEEGWSDCRCVQCATEDVRKLNRPIPQVRGH